MVESLRDSMKLQLSLELQSISNLFTIHYYLLLQKMVGQNGLALLRQSQVGCNSPLDCCQEPPFESILALSALRCSVLWGSVSFFRFCRSWWAKMDSNHRPHDYQSCALASWAIGPFLVEISGIEPLTSCLQGRRSPSWAKPPNLFPSSYKVLLLCTL